MKDPTGWWATVGEGASTGPHPLRSDAVRAGAAHFPGDFVVFHVECRFSKRETISIWSTGEFE